MIFILLFFLYLLLVGLLVYAWIRSPHTSSPRDVSDQIEVTIVIAARNESQSIVTLLKDISNQTYANFRTIVVDDHSVDDTYNLVRTFGQSDQRFSVIKNSGEGKKAALTTGIKMSETELIVTTDADCRVDEQWLETMVAQFHAPKIKLVFGGVKIESSSFFGSLQSHEFMSLVGTSAATLWWGVPSMCNGANLAFRKSVFLAVRGYENNFHIPSGDDEFLMHKIFQRYPYSVRFVSDRQAIVRTYAVSLKQFIHQRVRWAGKWSHNLSPWNILLAMFIFLFQASVIVLPVAAMSGYINPFLATTLLLSKAGLEFLFLKRISNFLNVRWSWRAFLTLQLIYPIYVIVIATISSFFSFEWKGRTLKSFTVSTVKK